MKLKQTDFNELRKIHTSFKPYKEMWYLARDFFFKETTWYNGFLSMFERDEFYHEINGACKNLLKIEKISFKERRHSAEIAKQLRAHYETLNPHLPLIIALRNPNLKLRHWNRLTEMTGIKLDANLAISLQDLLDQGVSKWIEDINEISDCASREQNLEDSLHKMREEWKQVAFEVHDFRDSGTYVLKKAEPIWELLDEQIVKTMVIASSPYVKFLKEEVGGWKSTLLRVQEILDYW